MIDNIDSYGIPNQTKHRFLVHHEKNGNTILPLLYILVNVLTITSRSLS